MIKPPPPAAPPVYQGYCPPPPSPYPATPPFVYQGYCPLPTTAPNLWICGLPKCGQWLMWVTIYTDNTSSYINGGFWFTKLLLVVKQWLCAQLITLYCCGNVWSPRLLMILSSFPIDSCIKKVVFSFFDLEMIATDKDEVVGLLSAPFSSKWGFSRQDFCFKRQIWLIFQRFSNCKHISGNYKKAIGQGEQGQFTLAINIW